MKGSKQVAYFVYRYAFPVAGVIFLTVGLYGDSGLVLNPSIWFGIVFFVISCFVWYDFLFHGKTSSTLTQKRHGHTTVSQNHSLYSAGGAGEYSFRSTLEDHDLRTGESNQLSDSMNARRYLCGELYNNQLHLIGGETDDGPTDLHRTYDVDSGKWERCADLPEPRKFVSSARLGERIYVFGGTSDGVFSDRVDIYSIPDDSWDQGSSMPRPKNTSVTALDDLIYVPADSMVKVSGGFTDMILSRMSGRNYRTFRRQLALIRRWATAMPSTHLVVTTTPQ